MALLAGVAAFSTTAGVSTVVQATLPMGYTISVRYARVRVTAATPRREPTLCT
jgi:hypothetical protein